MHMPETPAAQYHQRLKELNQELLLFTRKRSRLGWARFLVFVLTIAVSYQVFVTVGWTGLFAVITGLALLLYLISIDVNNNQKISNTKMLIRINEEELRVLDHDYFHRYDGHHLAPDTHNYAHDLDIFGKASLFQWSSRCETEQGRQALARDFLHPVEPEEVQRRHEAVKELAPDLAWRQQLQALGQENAITRSTQRKAESWLKEDEKHFIHPAWKFFVNFYSLLTVSSAIASILGYIPAGIFSFFYGIFLVVSIILSRNTVRPYILLSGIVKEINTLQQLVRWIEDKSFHAPLLIDLQASSRTGKETAGSQIRDLKNILDRFDLRLNIAGLLFFNAFLLWDVRQMMALNEWRRKNRDHLATWFSLVAEMEVLASLSAIRFNEPGWAFPRFSSEPFTFRSKDLGHPLIPVEQRVSSDFDLEGQGKIALVTGSNMAGKSTFLRSLGVNTVLAQMGAPVCAEEMTLSPVHLMSSMRIADNLAENTSTFYAELKKLKTIIEAVRRHEPLFILLDEILRGTNSRDRHTGSEALIHQLIRENAVAVIATHDLALARLEEQFPGLVENYHFDVQVEGEELYFDYRLKHGVCTSLNASILMKKIGIELEAGSHQTLTDS